MKYNAPYGAGDQNASYINGNPATGTMGSIPPAASIENPQRELANFITKSGLTPTDADLFQLSKAVQSGIVNYCLDIGSANAIEITPVVLLASYVIGNHFLIKVAHANSSTVTINVNGLGTRPLVHSDLSPMLAWELFVGQLIEVGYDGTSFQLMSGGGPNALVTLTAPQHLYVNDSIGSDTTYDGTSATIGGTSGPFKTIEKALNTMKKYNLGGWDFNIHVADGTYTRTLPLDFPLPNGSGTVKLIGNASNPSAVSIFNTSEGSCWRNHSGGYYDIHGFAFRATASLPGDAGSGVWFTGASGLLIGDCSFGACPGQHMFAGPTAFILVDGAIFITGSAAAHMFGWMNGAMLNNTPDEPTLTISNAVTFSVGFAWAQNGGQTRPMYASITGAGNVTGPKYYAVANGVIETAGRGANYLPGTTGGSLATGGQYI